MKIKLSKEYKPTCPNLIEHTVQPEGYLQWHYWAEQRYKEGYRQKKCKGCGLFTIWHKPTKKK